MADPTPAAAGLREPSFTVVRAPGSLRRVVLQVLRLAASMALLAGGIVGLTTTGHLGLPFQRVVTLRGRLAYRSLQLKGDLCSVRWQARGGDRGA